jgi:DNA-binding NarL/FixJ family response regulator
MSGVPRMLSDIISGLLEAQQDIVVVGVVERAGNLLEALGDTRPDIVILGIDGPTARRISAHLLSRRPEVKVMGVSADGRNAFMYELRPHRVALGALSAERLVEVIREQVIPSSGTTRGLSQTGNVLGTTPARAVDDDAATSAE